MNKMDMAGWALLSCVFILESLYVITKTMLQTPWDIIDISVVSSGFIGVFLIAFLETIKKHNTKP